jgi:hypothetical protein
VDDVEPPPLQRERQVCPDSYRDAYSAPSRDRERRAESDDVRGDAVEQRPPARDQIGRARRRSEHGDVVPERAQLPGEAVDVLVDVVRPRPGERSDQADAETHDSPSVVGERQAARKLAACRFSA